MVRLKTTKNSNEILNFFNILMNFLFKTIKKLNILMALLLKFLRGLLKPKEFFFILLKKMLGIMKFFIKIMKKIRTVIRFSDKNSGRLPPLQLLTTGGTYKIIIAQSYEATKFIFFLYFFFVG